MKDFGICLTEQGYEAGLHIGADVVRRDGLSETVERSHVAVGLAQTGQLDDRWRHRVGVLPYISALRKIE